MSAADATAPAVPGVAAGQQRGGFGRVMLAEWTKIRSVKSTAWSLILFVVLTIGLTALFTWLVAANWTGPHSARRDASIVADPVSFIFGAGIGLGQLTICVLGVLVISSEYSSGVIRASLLAVPRRVTVLAAKVTVFALLALVVAEVVAFGSFLAGAAILHSKVAVSLHDPGVLRATAGAGLYLTVLGLFSLGVGALIRHTAGAISTAVGVVFLLPILTGLLPDGWFYDHLNAYLPEQAGARVFAAPSGGGQLLSAWQGLGVLGIWTALALCAAAWLLHRRDA